MTTKLREEQTPTGLRPLPEVAGHSIQQDESQHALLIDETLLLCKPVEYRLLALLLAEADQRVGYDKLIAQLQFQGTPLTDKALREQAKNKVHRIMSRLRPKIWPLGLDVVCVRTVGYTLLSCDVRDEE